MQGLRAADAKYRLAYILTRAAQLDCERDRLDRAERLASEALEYATLLQRATEMALAHSVLACTANANGDADDYDKHRTAVEELTAAGVANWALTYISRLAEQKEAAAVP